MARKSKLTFQDAENIRRVYQDIETPIALLAQKYKVTESMISKVLHGCTLSKSGNSLGDCRKRGGGHYRAKLREEDVRAIRKLIAHRVPLRLIGAKYKVSLGTISSIAYGKTWKHVK